MSVSCSQNLPEQFRLGKYTILGTLGQGGFGITYLALNRETNARVVIKENFPFSLAYREPNSNKLRARETGNHPYSFEWYTDNFYKEAQTLTSLNHPNIVRIIEYFKANNTSYFVMPHVEGISLAQYRSQNGQLTSDWIIKLLTQLLNALSYLHTRNLLHRDIKPENILLTPQNTPLLIDFGSAKRVVANKSQTSIVTQGYSPIEQETNTHGNLGPWSDLYALGASMYYLIMGTTPPLWSDRLGHRSSSIDLTSDTSVSSEYSKLLLWSIDKAMELMPENRWQSADEWLAFLAGRSSQPQPSNSTQTISSPYANSNCLSQNTQLGNFIIQQVLKQGSTSITYLALDISQNNLIQLKENFPEAWAIRTNKGSIIPKRGQEYMFGLTLQRFRFEAQLLGSWDHPGIIKCLQTFHFNGVDYYVMPHIEGQSLSHLLGQSGPIRDASRLLDMLLKLLDILQYLHSQNCIHRNLKPSNILMLPDGNMMLTDFSIVCDLSKEDPLSSKAQSGTPGYAPPEQFISISPLGPWSDIYALGATMYKLLTGTTPTNSRQRFLQHVPFESLSQKAELLSSFPQPLLWSIDKALELDPTNRWLNAVDWIQFLKASVPSSGIPTHQSQSCLQIIIIAIFIIAGIIFYLNN